MDAESDNDQAELAQLMADWRRRKSGRDAKRLGDVINELVARRGYLRTLASQDLNELWQDVAGKELAADSRPGNVRRGTLDIYASSSIVLQELTFRQQELVTQIQHKAPQLKIRKLRFRLGVIED
jgi:predicted nucleic acid-binding Zn ribbon protein